MQIVDLPGFRDFAIDTGKQDEWFPTFCSPELHSSCNPERVRTPLSLWACTRAALVMVSALSSHPMAWGHLGAREPESAGGFGRQDRKPCHVLHEGQAEPWNQHQLPPATPKEKPESCVAEVQIVNASACERKRAGFKTFRSLLQTHRPGSSYSAAEPRGISDVFFPLGGEA